MPIPGWMIALLLLGTTPLWGVPQEPARSNPGIQLSIRPGRRSGPEQQALRLGRLDIRVEVAADLAETTLEFQVDNPNPWPVEGELRLPLGEEQKVTGFALDMAGKLREASVVDRAKAEATYTSIVSRQVDPGLLDQVEANLYRIRIFPIPGLGSRRVRVGLLQGVQPVADGSLLALPLVLQDTPVQAALEVRVRNAESAPVVTASPLPGLNFVREGERWVARKEAANLPFAGVLGLQVRHSPEAGAVWIGLDRGKTYAFAHVRLPALDETKPLPGRILLAWDCSVSGQERDAEREWAVLEDYLKGQPDCEVQVWAFNRTVFERRTFARAGRDLPGLKSYLLQLPADGTCNLGALDFTTAQAQEIILCTPGRTRLFKGEPRTGSAPIQILTSSAKADLVRLRALARRTGGEAFDLTQRSRAEVRRLLRRLPFQFLKAELLEGQVTDVVPAQPRPVRGGMDLACVLVSPRARFRLSFGRSGQTEVTREVTFSREEQVAAQAPRRLWANAQLEALEEAEAVLHQGRHPMLNLALEHGLVSQDTSLLVLETLVDYHRYGIALPEDLQSQSAKPSVVMSKPRATVPEPMVSDFVEDLEAWQNGRSLWWAQPFRLGVRRAKDEDFFPQRPKGSSLRREVAPPPPMPPAPGQYWPVWCVGIHSLPALGYPGGVAGGDEEVTFRPGQRREALMRELNGLPKDDTSLRYAGAAGVPGGGVAGGGRAAGFIGPQVQPSQGSALLPGPTPDLAPTLVDDPLLPQEWPESAAEEAVRTPRHWRLGAERVKALARAHAADRWPLYLSYKKTYCQSLGFILDCSRSLAQAGRRDLAWGIASNLAEPQRQGPSGDDEEDEYAGRQPRRDADANRLMALGELLWELGDLEGACLALEAAQNLAPRERALLLRRANLALARSRAPEALALFDQAAGGLARAKRFDPLQGVAWEEGEACRLRLGQAIRGSEPPKAWGLRIQVESVFGLLPEGSVSVLDPRGERVWHEMPLGTEGLGLDDASEQLSLFMVRKPSAGSYRVELRPGLFGGDDHVPDEVRVTVTFGFGTRRPRTQTFCGRLSHAKAGWVAASFQVEAPVNPTSK